MLSFFHSLKSRAVLLAVFSFASFTASSQTLIPFATEKTLSLYVGTSMNLGHSFSTENLGASQTYVFDHQNIQPGLALNLSYTWFKDLGDWLYGSFHFTAGIQQDNFSATFLRLDDASLESFSAKRTLVGATAAYRLGVDIVDHWQVFLGLGPYLRFPVKNNISMWGLNTGVEAEVGVYYLINSNLCCSFLARYDILPFGSLFSDHQGSFATGAYLDSNGRALTCMLGIGYRY